MKNVRIDANGTEVRIIGNVLQEDAYISLTDIAKYRNPDNAFTLTPQEMSYTYASEADILNVALVGKTAAQWRNEQSIEDKTGEVSSCDILYTDDLEKFEQDYLKYTSQVAENCQDGAHAGQFLRNPQNEIKKLQKVVFH